MRCTVTIDDALLKQARDATGVMRTATLVQMGLEALVARAAARRLAELGGSQKNCKMPRR